MPRTAEIIAVGSELLTGGVTNTNAAFLSRLLTAAGVEVLYHTTVDDDAARLEKAVTIARGRAELLVFTGGLGPTYDDMTKTAVCAALDTPLVLHQEVVEDMRRYFEKVFRREMPECDMQQAYLPAGCTVFRNPVGTAPGCVFTAGKTTAALLPGVPHECRYMAEHCLLPWLEQVRGQTVRSHTLHIFGLTEPQVQAWDAAHPDLAGQNYTMQTATNEDGETIEVPVSTGRPKSVLPVQFKFGTDDEPQYHQFTTLEELTEFYIYTMSYIQGCYTAGWARKRSTIRPMKKPLPPYDKLSFLDRHPRMAGHGIVLGGCGCDIVSSN